MVRTVGSDGTRTERAIHEAAIALIAAHGFEAMTMRALAERVGIQPGSLYRYHGSKHDLLEKLMTGHLRDLLAAWQSVKPASADPLSRLREFVDFHVGYHVRRRDEVFLANMELRSLDADARRRVTDLGAPWAFLH